MKSVDPSESDWVATPDGSGVEVGVRVGVEVAVGLGVKVLVGVKVRVGVGVAVAKIFARPVPQDKLAMVKVELNSTRNNNFLFLFMNTAFLKPTNLPLIITGRSALNLVALCGRVSNLVGLATEPAENFENFLDELRVLRGKVLISPSFWTLSMRLEASGH
jgi:hypothetical protein